VQTATSGKGNGSDSCFHCNEPLPIKNPHAFKADIAGQTQFFCCPACKTVAQTIHNLGLDQYYRQRNDKAPIPASVVHRSSPQDFSDRDIPENFAQFICDVDNVHQEARLFIPDIHCASCCWLIEQHLSQLSGVQQVQSRLDNHKLIIRWKKNALKPSKIFAALAQIGYSALPWQPTQQQQRSEQQQQQLLRRLGVAGILAMQIHMIAMGQYFGADDSMQHWLNSVALLLSLPLWFYCADPFFRNVWRNLKSFHSGLRSGSMKLLTASMDLPVVLAIVSAAIVSVTSVIRQTSDLYFDSIAMFVFLLLGARYLEAQGRARMAIQAQEPQLPNTCTRLNPDGSEQRIAIRELQQDDRVLVAAGQIPVDGIVLRGSATVDQSSITGEFVPVTKSVGDQVIAGTNFLQGELLLHVTASGDNCHIAQLHRRMEQALSRKSNNTIYDRVAQWFTPAVLLIAVSSALFWAWQDASRTLTVFLAVLVASCPCALSLAIPAALTAATLQLRKRGILVTGSHVLHKLPDIHAIAFDKTGTLTQGRMQILQTEIFTGIPEKECLAIAQVLESHSTHPVASAFNNHGTAAAEANKVDNIVHCGIEGTVDGKHYRLGKIAWCTSNSAEQQPENTSGITVGLASENQLLARFLLGDTLRNDAVDCIRALQKNGMHCTIISGDNSLAVETIAKQLGITDLHRNCTPEQKVEQLASIKNHYGPVAMVGDGINDGPVLAHADVSLALAEASQTAQLAADVVLLNNRLSDVLALQQVALQTRSIARQNLAWALLYNISILPFAAAGLLPPVAAALGMAASSLLVTLNALRLLNR
jgi:Cu2+-exporting ATPase